jgi:hypothetical protein
MLAAAFGVACRHAGGTDMHFAGLRHMSAPSSTGLVDIPSTAPRRRRKQSPKGGPSCPPPPYVFSPVATQVFFDGASVSYAARPDFLDLSGRLRHLAPPTHLV